MYRFKLEDAERFAAEQGIQVRTRGKELIFRSCPYCRGRSTEKEKFSINTDTGQFHCFRASCGAKGNMLTLAKDFAFSLGEDTDEYYFPIKKFKSLESKGKPISRDEAVAYLKQRGISEEICRKYHITVQTKHPDILVFPFYDEKGMLQFIKYRKTDFDKSHDKNKEWCEAGCKPILFGMDHCVTGDRIVITEGQIDSLSLAESGVENAVSVPNGAKGFTWIPYCWDFINQYKEIVVFGDCEHGEITLVDEIVQRFSTKVKHVRAEDYKGCKDANELLVKYGKQAVMDAVGNAAPVKDPQIISLYDVKSMDLSEMESFSTGMVSLDRILGGFYMGQLVLLTGERGLGKSTLASQFGTLGLKESYNVFFYSGELMNWYFKAWFERQIAGRSFINKAVSGFGYTDYSINAQVIPYMREWYKDMAYLYDNNAIENGSEEESLIKVLETAIKRYGCRILFIDNLMTAMADDMSIDQYRQQTKFVSELAKMTKRFNVLIFLVAHPRKKVSGGFDNDDVAGSSNITNLVDVVIRYSRPKDVPDSEDTKERELTVLKNRLTGETNRRGIRLFFDPASKRISETPDGFDWRIGWEEKMSSPGLDDGEYELPF